MRLASDSDPPASQVLEYIYSVALSGLELHVKTSLASNSDCLPLAADFENFFVFWGLWRKSVGWGIDSMGSLTVGFVVVCWPF